LGAEMRETPLPRGGPSRWGIEPGEARSLHRGGEALARRLPSYGKSPRWILWRLLSLGIPPRTGRREIPETMLRRHVAISELGGTEGALIP